MKKETEKDLYAPGEERFGPIGSRMYSSSRIIPAIGKFYKFVLEDLNSMEFQDLLDIGSGTGHVIITLAEMKQNFNGTGIDPSRHMVNVATNISIRYGVDWRIKFETGSSREIPGNGKYDIIISSMSFHHWKEREKSIEGIMERLKPEGRFIVYEVTDDGSLIRRFVKSHLMEASTFSKIALDSGLKIDLKEKKGYIRCMFKKHT